MFRDEASRHYCVSYRATRELTGPRSPAISSPPSTRTGAILEPATQRAAALLELSGLNVTFKTRGGLVEAVRGINLEVAAGETVGIVGESGSGKSQMMLAAMGLLAANGTAEGSIKFRGQEMLGLRERDLNRIRGSKMTMVFQDPLTSLTPHMRVGRQIAEVLTAHFGLSRRDAEARALALMDLMRISDAKRRMRQYPHELSGGMRQRIMIAIAAAARPELLIADEPTTALDVTVQAQILEIVRDLQREFGTAVVWISHDMGVIAAMCSRIHVMRDGRFLEGGDAASVFRSPREAYTRLLIDAAPRFDRPARPLPPAAAGAAPLLEVKDLKVHFPVAVGTRALVFQRSKRLRAVDGVSFALAPNETLGIVGESGSGKSTLARAILWLIPATVGEIVFLGRDVRGAKKEALRRERRNLQIVFQDPLASLDPRMTIGESIAEPMREHGHLGRGELRSAALDMMQRVRLDESYYHRYPHELSGGQNQRAGIARAMILRPKLVICDEAVSALDVSIRAQIVELLLELQRETGLSMLFISHDLSVIRQVSHRILVMFMGRVMEVGDARAICESPGHPYTKALVSAVPIPDPEIGARTLRAKLTTEIPSPLDTRSALFFLKSRMIDDPDAEQYVPKLVQVVPGHFVSEHD